MKKLNKFVCLNILLLAFVANNAIAETCSNVEREYKLEKSNLEELRAGYQQIITSTGNMSHLLLAKQKLASVKSDLSFAQQRYLARIANCTQ